MLTEKNPNKKHNKRRHYFFLNSYEDRAFTKCPKCDGKTKLRKFPLVIHIDPEQLILLNKKCRYCTHCDLIITKKSEMETLMVTYFEDLNPDIIGNNYLTIGVVERKDWQQASKGKISQNEIIERVYVFKDMLNFEPVSVGWYPERTNRKGK